MSRKTLASALTGILVIASAGIFLWSAVRTSSARVAATTSGESFFAAGEIRLDQPESRVELLFDDDGLFPGRVVSGCVLVRYDGTLPADVRLHGERTGGTGLDDYVEIRLWLATSCETEGEPSDELFVGRLSQLWNAHGSYGRGLAVAGPAAPGDQVAIRATAEVVDDNRAQGRTTSFTITVEARP